MKQRHRKRIVVAKMLARPQIVQVLRRAAGAWSYASQSSGDRWFVSGPPMTVADIPAAPILNL